MKLLNIEEHLRCFNYDHSENPQIEIKKYIKGETAGLTANTNEIHLFLKGSVKYQIQNNIECEVEKGKMLFLPIGYRYTCFTENNATIMVFHLYSPLKLCDSYFAEYLFDSKEPDNNTGYPSKEIKMLNINSHVWHLIQGLTNCITDGIKCRHYFDIKIKEFFIMLRAYYPKNELSEFLNTVLSRDIVFSEYVKNNRNKYTTVIALAESMCLTQKQFAKRFKEVFGRTPHEWMREGRVQAIQHEITTTKKPFKQIAIENNFNSVTQFVKYCKKETKKTPVELRNNIFYNKGKI